MNANTVKDVVFIIATILIPMDGLRLGKVGPAEILMLVWCLFNLDKTKNMMKSKLLIEFWLVFLSVLLLSTSYGVIYYPEESWSFAGVITYVYFAIVSIMVCQTFCGRSINSIYAVVKWISFGSSIWYFSLYILAKRGMTSLLGAPLWFYSKFTGGAQNPNKLASYLNFIFVLSIIVFKTSKKWYEKCLGLVCLGIVFFIGATTDSKMFILAVVATIGMLIIFEILKIFSEIDKIRFVTTSISLLCMMIMFLYDEIYMLFYKIVASDSNGLGRFRLFASITYTLEKNPIIGLGPGGHALNGTQAYHSTYFEILAMVGIVGMFVFVIFSIKLIKKVWAYKVWIVLIGMLYFLGIAHFAFRSFEYWVAVGLAIAVAETSNIHVCEKKRRISSYE